MSNMIVGKKYEDFINHLSAQFHSRLNDIESYRDTWKLYQDMFLWNIKNTNILLSSQCKNTVKKQKNTLVDLLSKLPLLDDTLLKELWDIKKIHMIKKPSYIHEYEYSTGKLDNYCRGKNILIDSIDEELRKKILNYYNDEYKNIYKPNKKKEYRLRKWNLKEKDLPWDKEIERIATERIMNNKKYYLEHVDREVNNIDEQINLLSNKIYNKDIEQYIKNLETKKEYWINKKWKIETENLSTKFIKFKNKLLELAYYYIISSHEHENENLRKKYVELFILDDYKDYIQFHKNNSNEYSFVLWPSPLQMIETKKTEILEIFNRKPVQLSFDFSDWE